MLHFASREPPFASTVLDRRDPMKNAGRRGFAILCVALLCVLFIGATAHAKASKETKVYWFETYMRAVDLIDTGQAADAASLLQRLIETHPVPKNAAKVPGNQYIDYLPYYQLARANAKLGNNSAAIDGLERSIDFGAINESRRHAEELDQLQRAIDLGLSPETVPSPSPAVGTVASTRRD